MNRPLRSRSVAAAALIFAGCAGQHGTGAYVPSSSASASSTRAQPNGAPAIVEITSLPISPLAIVSDLNGGEWTGGGDADPAKLISISEATHLKTEYAMPYSDSTPVDLALGRHQNGIWFADYSHNQVGWLNFSTHVWHRYTVPTHDAGLAGITAGPDNAMWFTERYAGKIGRIELAHFTISEYAVPNGADPYHIALGSDGALWFTEFEGNRIGRITTSQQISQYGLPHAQSGPYGITSGPDGALWFTEYNIHMSDTAHGGASPDVNNHGRIGRIDPATHSISEWSLSVNYGGPNGIARRNNQLWFAETNGYVGHIDATSHAIDEYQVPAGGGPRAIALGKDDDLWFAQADGRQVGKACPGESNQQCLNGAR